MPRVGHPRRGVQPAAPRPPRLRAGGPGPARAGPGGARARGRGAAPRARGRPGPRGAARDGRAGGGRRRRCRVSRIEIDRPGPSYTVGHARALFASAAGRRAVPDPRAATRPRRCPAGTSRSGCSSSANVAVVERVGWARRRRSCVKRRRPARRRARALLDMPLIEISSQRPPRPRGRGRADPLPRARRAWPSYIARARALRRGPSERGSEPVSPELETPSAGRADRRDRLGPQGGRHPRDRPARDRELHGLLRDLLGQHRAPDEGDPRRDLRGAEERGRACCRAAPRASARRAGSCSTTSTAWCTSSRPTRASTTASSSSGARPRPAPWASLPSGPSCEHMFVLSTNQKGALAETEDRHRGVRTRRAVLRPMQEHGRYDLAFEIGEQAAAGAVQVGRPDARRQRRDRSRPRARDARPPATCDRATPSMRSTCSRSTAVASIVATFCRPIWPSRRKEIWLRVRPTLNGQRACLNDASQFEFRGAVAQLEERVAGSHEVRGSSPLSSTPSDPRCGPAATSSATTSATTSSRPPPARDRDQPPRPALRPPGSGRARTCVHGFACAQRLQSVASIETSKSHQGKPDREAGTQSQGPQRGSPAADVWTTVAHRAPAIWR